MGKTIFTAVSQCRAVKVKAVDEYVSPDKKKRILAFSHVTQSRDRQVV